MDTNISKRSLPFWSWNDKLNKETLLQQIEWLHDMGFGGFFMHARAGLQTEYLSEDWFDCIQACIEKAQRLGMQAWAYDENGWPSGFTGGKLLQNQKNLEQYLSCSVSDYDPAAFASYDCSGDCLLAANESSKKCLNVYINTSMSTVDILDDEVVDQFIASTHELYRQKGCFQQGLRGFFTDEPQYCKLGVPFPHKIERFWQKNYNEDVKKRLGLLFIDKDGYRDFRYKYWLACQHLMLTNYAKKIYDWCDVHHVKLTGHFVEERDLFAQMLFNGGIMPFYEYEHIPGIDWLCRRFMTVVPPRQVGSVAAQLGKQIVLSECFAMTGWSASPKELKAIAEFQYLYGVNNMCQHLVPYSEREERKRDYPAHFTPQNPWVEASMPEFNHYFDWLGELMQNSEEVVCVAVFHPIRSAYFGYKHNDLDSTKELDKSLLDFCTGLALKHIAFHFLDETLLERHGFVDGAKIGCGKKTYDYLLFPKCYTIGKTTYRLISEFFKNGGKIYFSQEKPSYLEGEPFAYESLQTNVSLRDIQNAQPYSIEAIGGKVHATYRRNEQGAFLFLLNADDKEQASINVIRNGCENFAVYDYATSSFYQSRGEIILAPLQSTLIRFDESIAKTAKIKKDLTILSLPTESLEVVAQTPNSLLLDRAKFSCDGKNFSDTLPLSAIFHYLLKNRYCGNLLLRFSFTVKEIPEFITLISEYSKKAELFINGRLIDDLKSNLSNRLMIGKNEITVKLIFYEQENVYAALFRTDVSETLKNCLVYDTYLENLYLHGNFGVYPTEGFFESTEKNVLTATAFTIDKRQKIITELVSSGEPFFSGRIRLKTKIFLKDINVKLRLVGKIYFAKLYVNNKIAGTCLFDDTIDISKTAKYGENIIEVELFTSCRNLYGPHHNRNLMDDGMDNEKTWVTPNSFDLFSSWNDFQNENYDPSYRLFKSGLFE